MGFWPSQSTACFFGYYLEATINASPSRIEHNYNHHCSSSILSLLSNPTDTCIVPFHIAPMFFESGSSSSSSSSSGSGWTYDVFLSFRGEDTRKNFTDHLYSALVQAGIHTFRDDEALPRGQEISSQLRQAIRESRISIVVFSKGYASSRWCLDELQEIVECKQRNKDQIVLPIFYDIDPSDVRKQEGSFKEAFEKHEERFKEKVNKWKGALLEAGKLSGWNLTNMENGHEAKFIQMIIGDVSKKLDCKLLNMAKYQVGVDSRVNRVIGMCNTGANDVCMLGIYGMPGVGKTTIAKAAFNGLCYGYDDCSFLSDVKEISRRGNGIVHLQEQLLCQILKSDVFKIFDKDKGIDLIRRRLSRKRVLVVVDDVDQLEQLEALVGEKSWFGPGSIIIITTGDERLLTQFEVCKKIKVEELKEDESLQLFSLHAFRDIHPSEDWLPLSNSVVKYCGGLPLALEVLGSFLFKRTKTEWESTIEKLREFPDSDIQKKLQISFETLDHCEKDAFLDISCFFIGRDREYVEKILNARWRFKPEIIIVRLIERCLLTIGYDRKLRMHDLLRDMGREVVCQMPPQPPGERSRIWLHEDAVDVLRKQMGTKTVEGLALEVRAAEAVSFSTESFANMRHLKLLQINGVQLDGSYKLLSRDLIWLCWRECPLESWPSDFQLDNIAILDMQHANLRELWREAKSLNKLKILNLSHSEYLAKTPNFLGCPKLERLILEDCPSLIEVHQSIGHLRSLVFLNLKGCCKLRNLPGSICNLKYLVTLNLSMCSQLEELPDSLGYMESLTELLVDETAIMTLPSSIGNLKNLITLSLSGCSYRNDTPSMSWLSKLWSWVSPRSSSSKALLPASFFGLASLMELSLCDRHWSESEISSANFGSLYSLDRLDLSGNDFFNLPSGIGRLPKLKSLWANRCNNLLSISEIPSSLERLYAYNCKSMERVSLPKKNTKLLVSGCQNLKEIQGIEAGANGLDCLLEECNNMSDDCKRILVQALGDDDYDMAVVGGEIPEWFSYRGEGCSVSFKVPDTVSHGELQALVVWTFVAQPKGYDLYPEGTTFIKNKTNGNRLSRRGGGVVFGANNVKQSWISHMTFTGLPFQIEGRDELELHCEFEYAYELEVERCGVHLILQKPHTAAANVAVDDDGQGSTPLGCSEAQWRSYLTRELLQSSLQISSVAGNRKVLYEIEDNWYGWAQKEGESHNYHRVKFSRGDYDYF